VASTARGGPQRDVITVEGVAVSPAGDEGDPVEDVPPYRRNVNMVFQRYALFGHLDVADNGAFGLQRRHRLCAPHRPRQSRRPRTHQQPDSSDPQDRRPTLLATDLAIAGIPTADAALRVACRPGAANL